MRRNFSSSLCLIFAMALIFISCKSSEEKRLVEIGNGIVQYSFSDEFIDIGPKLDSMLNTPIKLFEDVQGLPSTVYDRIRQNGPKGQVAISVEHKLSEKGLRLYLLHFKGPIEKRTTDFNMTVTFYYTSGQFHFMDVRGGEECG